MNELDGLTGSEFSSPLLGKVYTLLQRRFREGLSTQLSALTGELEGDEMDHLAHVVSQPESLANSHQSLCDYIGIIRRESLRRRETDQDDLLRSAQKKYLEKKAYVEDKP